MGLVAAHHPGDVQPAFAAVGQQLRAAVEGQGQGLGTGRDLRLALRVVHHLLRDHEAAAHRVPRLLAHGAVWRRVGIGPGRQPHRIGVEGQLVRAVEDQVTLGHEGHRVLLHQRQAVALADGLHPAGDGVHGHGVGHVPHQAQQHRAVAAMATPGGAQGAHQHHPDALHTGQQPAVHQVLREMPGRAHRPDGVRTRRADAHLEEVQDGDSHVRFPLALTCLASLCALVPDATTGQTRMPCPSVRQECTPHEKSRPGGRLAGDGK